jgi:phosphatidylserine/phosphatidylglycerophosphate/cardiolipin synthase-like enzyme
MHHKAMIIDGRIVVTGSYNWAWPAEENNYENVLVIEDSEVAAMYEMEFQGLWDHGLMP